MKTTNRSMLALARTVTTLSLMVATSPWTALAALNIPSDGSDGALVLTNDTVIDLSQAITGNWDANNSANAGKGVYDATKWAVVFKYSRVTIQGGATVTFKNHASRAPVAWLVNGDVAINGTVSLDGEGGSPYPARLLQPGPGGFRGGSSDYGPGAGYSDGFGPGGAHSAGWASYGSGPDAYGNPSMVPLVGGSGSGYGYGAGGGAILIASAGQLTISGKILSNGGNTYGSGGGIRLVAETLNGNGDVQALGQHVGRIRIERVTNTSNLQIAPDSSVVTLPSGATPQIWLPTNGPTVRIVSIGGNSAPADPRAEFAAIGADLTLPQVTNATVVVETTNVEAASVVTVRASPRSNGNFTQATAAVTQLVSEDPLVLRWTANVPVNAGYSAIQVKVVRP